MTTTGHVIEILKNMNPMEIIELCGLDQEPEELVYALSDHIVDNIEEVIERLVENGEIEEEDI